MIYENEGNTDIVKEPSVQYDLTSPVVITKYTFDRLLKEDHSAELIALYSFYVYTASWQKTNQPRCTTSYVAKGIGWSIRKVQTYKSKLVELNLIEDIVRKDSDNQKIVGWYIKVHFVKNG